MGRELQDVVKNRPVGRPLRLDVGVVDVLPKIVVQTLLEPALSIREPVRIVCREATSDQLLGRLATHELDVALSDSPIDPTLNGTAICSERAVSFLSAGSVLPEAFMADSRTCSTVRQCFCPLTIQHCAAISIFGLNQRKFALSSGVSSRTMHSSELSAKPEGAYFRCLQWCRSTFGNKRG